jgi:DNA-binding NarL/FixJ family response regulator
MEGISLTPRIKGLRILIAENHEVVRRGIRSLLEDQPEWTVCGEAATSMEAIHKTQTLRPDVLLLDVTMPDMEAAKAIPQIINICPTVKIVAMAMEDSAELAADALAAGANALALKSEAASDLVLMVQHIENDPPFLSPAALMMIRSLESLAMGRSNNTLALPSGISVTTVSPHRTDGIAPPSRKSLAAREPNETRPVAKRGRVLLVEQDEHTRDYLRCLLIPHHDVTTAANGRDCLAFASADPPDLVLCGEQMPVGDGLGLIEALRADSATKTLPIILLSARTDEDSFQSIAALADDCLAKPFTARELVARVNIHLSLSEMRRQEAQRARGTIEAELKGMTRLHEVSSRLLAAPSLHTALEEILVATCTMMGSRMGYVQVYDPRSKSLAIAVQRSFPQEFLDQLCLLNRDGTSRALMNGGRRVIIEDVNEDEAFRSLRAIAASGQSSPLLC